MGNLLGVSENERESGEHRIGRYLACRRGWIGALWLASLALERHGPHSDFIERFSGSERAVADYLAEDVLAQQPASVRDFLLRTSILRTLDAQVCQALVPRADGAAMLQALEQAHLFLVPLADEAQGGQGGHSWRYHSMFADFLRAQLLREQPGELTRLHLAASGWYESCGRPVPAIEASPETSPAVEVVAASRAPAAGIASHSLQIRLQWSTANHLDAVCRMGPHCFDQGRHAFLNRQSAHVDPAVPARPVGRRQLIDEIRFHVNPISWQPPRNELATAKLIERDVSRHLVTPGAQSLVQRHHRGHGCGLHRRFTVAAVLHRRPR